MQEATGDSGSSQADSWVAAKRYAGLFGALPSSFTTSIRILMRDQVEFDAAMRPVTKYQVARILKVGSFKGMLYYASKDLMGEYIKDKEFVLSLIHI